MSCSLCRVILTDEDLSFYREKYAALPSMRAKEKASAETLKAHYVLACRKHWCSCMNSGISPWSWLNTCNRCDNAVCKSCQCFLPHSTSAETLCSDCFWKTLDT